MTPRRLLALLIAINVVLLGAGSLLVAPRVDRAGKGIRVGLVFDLGGKNDRSFNEAAWRGLERARTELGVSVQYIEPSEGSDRESALRMFASRGVDLVIGVGFIFGPDLERLAAQFPNVKFAGVDYVPSPGIKPLPNLLGLQFHEHEGSFLVGAIAGSITATHKVGFVGGMTIPLIRKFEAGYAAGVKHVCPACVVLGVYAGSEPKAFADPTRGQELAASLYDNGADVIFHAAGKTGDGVFAAARVRRQRAIGVDSDQHAIAPCCVVTSMIKRVDVAVVDAVRSVIDGSFHGGVRALGLAEQGVGFVADEHNRHLLPAEVVQRVNRIAADIIAGTIEVPAQ
ncbi:MAG: BMP family protein [Kofleriaceae bacterium]